MGGKFSRFDCCERFWPSRVLTFHSAAEWKAHFDASKQTDKLMVIDFFATWCGPCKYMGPIFKDFAQKYTDVEFVKIDVNKLEEVAKEFGVQSMPTFKLFKKGKVVDEVVGASTEDLQNLIEKHRRSVDRVA
ncbi:hypothetical protein L6164_027160 [Bauhinia variegata]|uniref:Uncharacterized protein n=1 Tax=Bauhinia variegata TaxID=167791 RepID=A0ACB9LT80_BAUVA|nr:hypothetical protein L6164_027160 [Bauhinia variegata]